MRLYDIVLIANELSMKKGRNKLQTEPSLYSFIAYTEGKLNRNRYFFYAFLQLKRYDV